MWILIFSCMAILTIISLVYVFFSLAKLTNSRKLAALVEILGLLTVYLTMGTWNVMIVFMHVLLFFLLADLLGKFTHKELKIYSLALCALYLLYGYCNLHHVQLTSYQLETDKSIGNLRLVGFADSHMGNSFSGQEFGRYVDEINQLNPDIVFIAGDYVDDDTSKQDMIDACGHLARLKPGIATYYVFGNHDRGYNRYRNYNQQDLEDELTRNGVIVLKDEQVNVKEGVSLIGRLDSSYARKAMNEYNIDEDYLIVLDHEPNDYANEMVANLVLSGHTHGGQLIPIIKVSEWLKINDFTYGHKRIGQTDFIVTSGISDWAIQFKTGCISEYLVIDIQGK